MNKSSNANNNRPSYEELESRLSQLETLLLKLTGENNSPTIEEKPEKKIQLDDYIQVMSLCNYTLNLSTEGLGRGKKFTFTKFGEIKRIMYKDLVDILEAQSSFLEKGLFYLLNKDVIRKIGRAHV